MAGKEHQTHSRDSHLTFAVVWDPETGLEAYSGCDLLLRPIPDEYDNFPESIYSGSQTLEYAFGLGDGDSISLQNSSKSITTVTSPSQTEEFPKSLNRPSTSTSPSSKLTFAALWDPKIGLSAFNQGKLTKFIPSTKHRKWPSASTPAPAPDTGHHSYGQIDNIKRGFYLRVLPELGSHSTAPSSTFEGHHHKPHFSCFDPLNELSLFEPRLHPFTQFTSGPAKKANHLLGMNEDYATKGYDFSHTGDPYLPSRFSTSTTSTSGYVPINPSSVHFIPPVTFLGSRSRKRTIPRLFKNAPWSKGSKDDKWVFVEVQSVVTDRVVDKL